MHFQIEINTDLLIFHVTVLIDIKIVCAWLIYHIFFKQSELDILDFLLIFCIFFCHLIHQFRREKISKGDISFRYNSFKE